MTRIPLAETLTALAEGALPHHEHLVVEAAELSLPLLITMDYGPDGPRFFAQPPNSAYRSGVEPVHHRVRMCFAEMPADPATFPPAPTTSGAGPARPTPEGAVFATTAGFGQTG